MNRLEVSFRDSGFCFEFCFRIADSDSGFRVLGLPPFSISSQVNLLAIPFASLSTLINLLPISFQLTSKPCSKPCIKSPLSFSNQENS